MSKSQGNYAMEAMMAKMQPEIQKLIKIQTKDIQIIISLHAMHMMLIRMEIQPY